MFNNPKLILIVFFILLSVLMFLKFVIMINSFIINASILACAIVIIYISVMTIIDINYKKNHS